MASKTLILTQSAANAFAHKKYEICKGGFVIDSIVVNWSPGANAATTAYVCGLTPEDLTALAFPDGMIDAFSGLYYHINTGTGVHDSHHDLCDMHAYPTPIAVKQSYLFGFLATFTASAAFTAYVTIQYRPLRAGKVEFRGLQSKGANE